MSLNKSVNWIFFPSLFLPLYRILLTAPLSRCLRSRGNYLLLLADVGLKNLNRRISIEIACGLIPVQTGPLMGSWSQQAARTAWAEVSLSHCHPTPPRWFGMRDVAPLSIPRVPTKWKKPLCISLFSGIFFFSVSFLLHFN